MVCFVYCRVGVEARVAHDQVDEVIYDHGDAIHTTEAFVERTLRWVDR
jgi:hypothetical protein